MRFLGTVIDEAPRVRLTKERIRSKKQRMTARQWKFMKTVDMTAEMDKFFKKV